MKRIQLVALLSVFALAFSCCAFASTSGRAGSGKHHLTSPRYHNFLACSKPPCVLPNVLITSGQSANTILAANPAKDSQLLAGLDEDYGGTCPFGSVNGGKTWYQSQNGRCAGETPSLAYGNNSTAYQVGSGYESDIEITSTSDNGNTWSTPVDAVGPLFADGSTLTPWLVVDNSAGSPYTKSLYIAATQISNSQVQSEITVSYSRDGGSTWTMEIVDPVQTEPAVDHYSRVAVGSDGTVYVTWQRCEMTGQHVNCGGTKAQMWLSKSTDGGNTWSSPVQIAVVTLAPDTCSCAFYGNLPHTYVPVANPPLVAVDNSTGQYAGSLYVVVYDWTGKQMRVGGSTWGKPVLVAGGAKHDQFFPSISISDAGVLGVTWLDRRHDPQDVFYQPFATESTDGGKSVGKNYLLARPLSNPYYGNMGDYTGNTWSGNYLYFTWPDTRNAVMQDYFGGLQTK
jgi:hypothetical protein